MKTLTGLIEAGQKHYQTNKRVGIGMSLLAVLSILGTLLTDHIAFWIFLIAAVAATIATGFAIYQRFRLKDHDEKLKAAIPYAETEQFDEKVSAFKDAVHEIDENTNSVTFNLTYNEVKDYVAVLNERIAPFKEKGEKNLSYEERIIYTLIQRAKFQLRAPLRKLDNLNVSDEDLDEIAGEHANATTE